MKEISYSELMGEHVLDLVKYHGKNVKIYSLAKILNPECAWIEDEVRILDFAFIDAKESLYIGKHSIIAWHCVVEGHANIKIGNRCFLGPGSKLLSSTYEFNGFYANEHLPEGSHQTAYGDIILEDDSYIGANSVVMPGVKVGEGAIVGANSLVNRNLKPWGIYFGNPVKLIGMRDKPTEECRKIIESIEWPKHNF